MTNTTATHPLYTQLDNTFNTTTGTDMGFEALISPKPYPMVASTVEQFRARYQLIKDFQKSTLDVFKSSLTGQRDPAIAAMVVADLPASMGVDYHAQLSEQQHQTPVFFRTDEPTPGKLSEVQCPGSGWCISEHLHQLYRENTDFYGKPTFFKRSMAEAFADGLRKHVGNDPIVHHLTENASRPHGMRYFIQRVRQQGVRYFSYDRNIKHSDCNFVRSHDFVSLLHHNFYADRMQRCNEGSVKFDLPPSALFDGKLIMAWPFWHKTRDAYSDEVRALFPYTSLVEANGFTLEDGNHISIDAFCELPKAQRDYYLKYAGTDIAINWGSKSVFHTKVSAIQCKALLEQAVTDGQRGKFWVLQKAYRSEENILQLHRDGTQETVSSYGKSSGFYGPEGLMGIVMFHKNFSKVHGSEDTVMSIVY
jgi:hypothetical protein